MGPLFRPALGSVESLQTDSLCALPCPVFTPGKCQETTLTLGIDL